MLPIIVVAALLSVFAYATVRAVTNIDTNIQTDGTLSVTGTTTTQSILFRNGWTLAPTPGAPSEITASDPAGNPAVILDQN